MTDERRSGIALIAGSVGILLTMALHPTGGGRLTVDQALNLATASGVAHSLAMVSVLLLFLGACGLTQRIAAADRLAFTALVTYGFACVGVLIATGVSGFVVPGIMQHMVRDIPAAAREWEIVISGIFEINQGFARVFSVAASIAIVLWSVSALRSGRLGRGVAIYGCVVSPLIIFAIGSGHLQMNVHGMAIVVLGQAIWFILVGSQLYSRTTSDRVLP